MTGWRTAAIVGNAEAVGAYWKLKTNIDSGMFEAVQLAAATALDEGDDVAEGDERDLRSAAATSWSTRCARSASTCRSPKGTIYVWAPVPDGHTLGLLLRAGARGVGRGGLAGRRPTAPTARASSGSRSRSPTTGSPRPWSGCAPASSAEVGVGCHEDLGHTRPRRGGPSTGDRLLDRRRPRDRAPPPGGRGAAGARGPRARLGARGGRRDRDRERRRDRDAAVPACWRSSTRRSSTRSRADADTRLLLFLAPWPGDGHPGAMSLDDKANARERAQERAG